MKYLKNYKWTWDLVSPSLKAKFQYLYNLEMINRANALANAARIPGLKNDIQNRLNELENLRQKILSEKSKTSNAIDNYTGVDGRGDGIDNAYNNGKYGQILKAFLPEYNKIIPHDNLTLFRIASNENDSKLTSPKSQYNENDVLGVATDTGKFYIRDGSSYSEYEDYDEVEDLIGLYRTFILEPEDNAFYYFWNPWKCVYLWSNKGPGVKEEDKPQPPEPTPDPDPPTPDPDPTPTPVVKNPVTVTDRTLRGDSCYTDNGENFVNNPGTINFHIPWTGTGTIKIVLVGDMQSQSISSRVRTEGSVGLTLDRPANPNNTGASDFVFPLNDSGAYWSRTYEFSGIYFTEGDHYAGVCMNCARWGHIYTTYIEITITPD